MFLQKHKNRMRWVFQSGRKDQFLLIRNEYFNWHSNICSNLTQRGVDKFDWQATFPTKLIDGVIIRPLFVFVPSFLFISEIVSPSKLWNTKLDVLKFVQLKLKWLKNESFLLMSRRFTPEIIKALRRIASLPICTAWLWYTQK